MNYIPADLYGRFDFCWSSCSLEHTGSISLGLAFVRNAMKCLRPGGIAVHTTEFNLDAGVETIDNWPTVLFRRHHFEALAAELAAGGHEMVPINYDAGSGVLDMFIDTPPFPHDPHPMLSYPDCPHLRLNVDGFPATSIGIIIRAAGSRA